MMGQLISNNGLLTGCVQIISNNKIIYVEMGD